jgi:hypothetical protein
MGLKSFLAELRRRGVLKVATVYLATGWVVMEGGGFLFQNFGAPPWALKTFTTVILLGFPAACLMAWGFEFTERGVRLAPSPAGEQPAIPRRSDGLLGALLVLVFLLVTASLIHDWRRSAEPGVAPPMQTAVAGTPGTATDAHPAAAPGIDPPTSTRTPVVVIMDTPAPRGVYERETRERSGTNADDLNELLRDLPISIHKESIGATWDREDQVKKQAPDLVLVHRSSFFHAMNLEFSLGYPGETGFDETRARHLYDLADNKLIAVLGFLGNGRPGTKFIVYSRGSGPDDFEHERGREAWLSKAEGRFPFLKGRVIPLLVTGGTSGGSFEDAETARMFRQQVQDLLGLPQGGGA